MRRSMRWLTILAFLSPVAPRALDAQQIRGTVRDSAGLVPIAGAVVSVLDSAGLVFARALTDEQGRFRLPSAPALTRVRVVRIGFRPREVRLPIAGPDGDVGVDLAMVAVPHVLEAVEVTGTSICPPRRDRGQALALWEQARDGLLATVVARETKPPKARWLGFRRELDPRSARIVSQRTHTHAAVVSRPFVAPHRADEFAIRGYMREGAFGRNYEGPDADVLLDESFFSTHCFAIQPEDNEHRDQVGLAFVPAPGRDTIVEISGVLWMDRTTPALRTLEFRYTGLEPAARAANSGGTLAFATMPNGVALMVRWSIRMAELGRYQRAMPSRGQLVMPNGKNRWEQYDVHVLALADSGGELVSASWSDGAQWKATLGTVTGHVVADGSGEPIGNVRVWLEGMDSAAITDSTGAFVFESVLPGPYTLWATDSTLAGWGIVGGKHSVIEVPRGLPMEVRVEMPSAADTFRETCREGASNSSAVLFGQVLGADGSPASDVAIEVIWMDNLQGQVWNGRRTANTDAGGRFHVCNVRRDRPLRLGVIRAGETVLTVPARVGGNHYVETVTIRLP